MAGRRGWSEDSIYFDHSGECRDPDSLADGLPGRAPKTISTQREVLKPLISILGNVPLRELTAADVRSALIKLAATRATRTVSR